MTTIASRYRGCLFGLAVGDAIGTTLENTKIVTQPLTDMVGGGPFDLVAGEFTDDTSTALLLAESLIASRGFDAHNQLSGYYQWYMSGHLSSTNECFDIGIGTRMAVLAFNETRRVSSLGDEHETRAGNGSLMRLAPIPMAYRTKSPEVVLDHATRSSVTTHTAIACIDACCFYASLIVGALNGVSKQELLDPAYFEKYSNRSVSTLCPEIATIVSGSYKLKPSNEIIGGGYVVHALEAALWAFHNSNSFEEGVLMAANLGNDADTTAAIYGQLAGAFYSEQGIRADWISKIAFGPLIAAMADELYYCSESSDFGVVKGEQEQLQTDAETRSESLRGTYINTHTCLILLEKEYAVIKRRLQPGPNQFRSLAELDEAVEAFKTAYLNQAPECDAKQTLLQKDFLDRIINTQRNKLKLKLDKPKITLPFALPKAAK